MTQKLANSLMDNLCCVFISAHGYTTAEKMMAHENEMTEYARQKFCEILEEFETDDEKWDIK